MHWPCGTKFLRKFIFADWRFFVFCRELIFAIRTNWFLLLGINFCDFRKCPVPSTDNIFVFIDYNWLRSIKNTYFQTINEYFIVYRFVSEWKRQAVIEQTGFLSTVFLCSELENIYSGVNFCGKNVCEHLEKSQKLEPAKISCHTLCPFKERQVKYLQLYKHGIVLSPVHLCSLQQWYLGQKD